MHRVRAGGSRGIDDAPDGQIALGSGRRTDVHGGIRGGDVNGVAVGVREDRRGGDPERTAGPCDAHGDLSAVGDEDAGEHAGHIRNTP